MYGIFENAGMVEVLFVSIPESVGLLAFGLGLIGAAMAIRWLLGRGDGKTEEEAAPKA